jgi:hypothetical protein
MMSERELEAFRLITVAAAEGAPLSREELRDAMGMKSRQGADGYVKILRDAGLVMAPVVGPERRFYVANGVDAWRIIFLSTSNHWYRRSIKRPRHHARPVGLVLAGITRRPLSYEPRDNRYRDGQRPKRSSKMCSTCSNVGDRRPPEGCPECHKPFERDAPIEVRLSRGTSFDQR